MKTTRKSWLEMINTKGIDALIGITKNTLYYLRSRANNHNEYPSTNTMEQHLTKAGYKVAQEKLWTIKNEKETPEPERNEFMDAAIDNLAANTQVLMFGRSYGRTLMNKEIFKRKNQ